MEINYYRVTKWLDTLVGCRGWFSHMIDKNIGCAIVRQAEKPKRYAVFVNGTEAGDTTQRKDKELIDDKHVICEKYNFKLEGGGL